MQGCGCGRRMGAAAHNRSVNLSYYSTHGTCSSSYHTRSSIQAPSAPAWSSQEGTKVNFKRTPKRGVSCKLRALRAQDVTPSLVLMHVSDDVIYMISLASGHSGASRLVPGSNLGAGSLPRPPRLGALPAVPEHPVRALAPLAAVPRAAAAGGAVAAPLEVLLLARCRHAQAGGRQPARDHTAGRDIYLLKIRF